MRLLRDDTYLILDSEVRVYRREPAYERFPFAINSTA